MPMRPEQFSKTLADKDLPPVILLAGSEALLVLEAADAVRARARETGCAERQVLDVDGRFDWDNLAREGATMSLFSTRRLIDLRMPSGRAGKAGGAALAEWAKSPPQDTVLLITCDTWSKKHELAWVKAIDKHGWFVPFWPIRPDQMSGWVAARMRQRGLDADASAARLLVDRTEGNLLAAAQEIDKLLMLGVSGRLDASALGSLVADSARFDIFKLTDAALAGDSARALRMLRGLRSEGAEPVMMMGWLVRQIESAMRLAQASDFDTQARKEGLWDARKRQFQAALCRVDGEQWGRCLQHAAHIDRISKGRAYGDVWRELDCLILAIADPSAGTVMAESA